MAFETPTLDDQIAFTVAHFAALFPADDVSALSFNYLWCVCLAAAVTDNHANIEAAKNDLMPNTEEGAVRWAPIRGVVPKTATPARKAQALRVFGTAATDVPALSQLVHEETGLKFQTTSDALVGPGGYVDCDVAGVDVGSVTRLGPPQKLRFTTPIADLEEIAELQLDLDEDGEDAESPGSLQQRVASRFSTPPLGGAQEDYVQWALAVTGWATAYAYPLRAGVGTVDLAALHAGSGGARIPTAPEVAELQAALDKKRPVSVKQFRVLTVLGEENNIEVTVVANGQPENAFDWDDTVVPAVDTYDDPSRTVTLAADRPSTMKAGDRVIFKNAGGTGTGAERVIESLSGDDAFVLEADAEGDVPANLDAVYSGGPLVQPARDAIQDLLDSLGTANTDDNRYGSWEGSLDPGSIRSAATSIDGVRRATVIAPADLVDASDPEYPDDGDIGLIIGGRIIVRCQH